MEKENFIDRLLKIFLSTCLSIIFVLLAVLGIDEFVYYREMRKLEQKMELLHKEKIYFIKECYYNKDCNKRELERVIDKL